MIKRQKTPAKFAQEIEHLAIDNKIGYLDAIILYAEENNLEMEVLASLVRQNPNLKEKLYSECMELNLVEKVATLF